MNRVLIISNSSNKMTSLAHAFEGFYKVKTALLSSADITEQIGPFVPDCMIFCAEGIKRQRLFPIMDLKEDTRYARVPFVLLANEEDREVFNENLFVDPDYIGEVTITGPKIRQIVDRLIATMGRTRRVLVVDDDVVVLRLIKSYLEKNYHVTCVKSGNMALQYMDKQIADCVLLDCFMPGMDGPQTLKKIRGTPNGKNVPVIFLTGNSEKDMVMSALSLRPSGFLVKPVKQDELIEKIEEAME